MRNSLVPAAVIAAFSVSAHASVGLGGYNFDYDISGDKGVRPVQVFDNGTSVYIQLSARSANPPAVMERKGGKVTPVPFRYEFPYLVVAGSRNELVLALDGKTALIARRATIDMTGVAKPVIMTSPVSPYATASAAPVPAAAAVVPPAPSAPVASAARVPAAPDYSGELVFKYQRPQSSVTLPQPAARVTAAPVTVRQPATVRQLAPMRHYIKASQGPRRSYRVQSGDTLYGLSIRFGVPVERLANINGIEDYNLIKVGQTLTLDGGASPLKEASARVNHPQQARLQKVSSASGSKPLLIRHLGAEMVKEDDHLVRVVKMASSNYSRIVIRGHSAAESSQQRTIIAEAAAAAMRDVLISKGVPAERLFVAENHGHSKVAPRVDIVLIGALKKGDTYNV